VIVARAVRPCRDLGTLAIYRVALSSSRRETVTTDPFPPGFLTYRECGRIARASSRAAARRAGWPS